jgi:hypothetical protein
MNDSAPKLIRYDLHTFKLNTIEVSGVQNLSVNQTFDVSTVPTWGNPFAANNFYKRPNVEVSLTKFLSNNVPSLVINTGVIFNSATSGILPSGGLIISPCSGWVVMYDYTNGYNSYPSGIELKDLLLSSISYKFGTDNFFTEDLNFQGHSLECSGIPPTSIQPSQKPNHVDGSGTVSRRKDFFISGVPKEVADHMASGHGLLSAEVNISFDYGEVPSYGRFLTVANKYVKYPFDISCSFEVIDRGFTPLKTGNILIESGYVKGIFPTGKFYTTGIPITNLYPYEDKDGFNEFLEDVVSGIYIASSGNVNDLYRSVYEKLTSTGIVLGIKNQLKIDLGNNNFLTSRERSGGDAGQSSYSIYKYTYKNTTSEFNISSG